MIRGHHVLSTGKDIVDPQENIKCIFPVLGRKLGDVKNNSNNVANGMARAFT
jgi:hypothetical protein